MPEKPLVALMYDFDKTLCRKDMQEYSFIPKVKMEPSEFWLESNSLAADKKMDRVLSYMYQMLRKTDMANQPVHREDFVRLETTLSFFPVLKTGFQG